MRYFVALALVAGAAGAADLEIKTERRGDGHAITYANPSRAPYQVQLRLTSVQNLTSVEPFPLDVVLKPGMRGDLARLSPADPAQGTSFRYSYRVFMGDPGARPDGAARYRLPFANGLTLRIGQAPDSPPITHNDAASRYAVDIGMPVGTPIVAARGGWIIQNVRPHGEGRLEEAFRDKANYVTILHRDGSWAIYAHLLNYSANVVAGQWIDEGVEIGLSGSSGFSGGPHLHFAVQRNAGGAYVSIPFRFYSAQRGEFPPRFRDVVTADYAPARAAADPGKRKSVRECMGPSREITDAVIACTEGRSP